jgi:hypothetical protein
MIGRATPNVIHGVLLINPKARFANDNSDLAFIVQAFGKLGVRIDILICSNYTGASFSEDNRMGCYHHISM